MNRPRSNASPRTHGAGTIGAALLFSLALAGCGTIGAGIGTEDDDLRAAGPTNIASLSDVVARNPNDPQAYNMRGSVFGRAGQYKEAVADFDRAIQLDPNYAQAFANRALAYQELKRFDLALADYSRAIQIDPNYAAAYVGRGILRRQQGQAAQALSDFNKAIQLKPDHAQAYHNRDQSHGRRARTLFCPRDELCGDQRPQARDRGLRRGAGEKSA
jgi:tetratricopeptide (TPR) repeat protein